MLTTVVVFSGGQPLTPAQTARLEEVEGIVAVVAADAGTDRAVAAGLDIDVVVGDLDSVSADGLTRARASGARVVEHPPDKDETDLELALIEAMSFEPDQILVTAVDGGRRDHYLASIAILADPRFRSSKVSAHTDDATLHVVWDHLHLDSAAGQIVSLLPVNGPAEQITTTGFLYPLSKETLAPSSPRGMSNVVTSPPATVTVGAGTLLAIVTNTSDAGVTR